MLADSLDGIVGTEQQISGVFDFDRIEIFGRRGIEFFFEFLAEIHVGIAEFLAYRLKSVGIVDVFIEKGDALRFEIVRILCRQLQIGVNGSDQLAGENFFEILLFGILFRFEKGGNFLFQCENDVLG